MVLIYIKYLKCQGINFLKKENGNLLVNKGKLLFAKFIMSGMKTFLTGLKGTLTDSSTLTYFDGWQVQETDTPIQTAKLKRWLGVIIPESDPEENHLIGGRIRRIYRADIVVLGQHASEGTRLIGDRAIGDVTSDIASLLRHNRLDANWLDVKATSQIGAISYEPTPADNVSMAVIKFEGYRTESF